MEALASAQPPVVPPEDVQPPTSGSTLLLRPPELLAPAGDWDCVHAAIENGADAIYFGLDRFNARMRARNFTEADLPSLMEHLHRRGVRGYVTFNTLVFPGEMAQAEHFARSIIAAGVDAAIVQDVGICRLLRELSPDFPLHASTQMTITSSEGVAFARDLGCQVVVLARELPIGEIAGIHRAMAGQVALEVFVHGALCVAYSGQCLTSESLGSRSANRGICAQACRMPYELLADGHPVDLGDRRYLLSPQDLVGVEALPELIRAGVASLKIEGRLKSPEYVANITRAYRDAVDQVWSALNGFSDDRARATGEAERAARAVMAARRYDLEMAFSRGLHPGWMRGINNQELVHARFGKKRGVYLGRVLSATRTGIRVQLEGPLKPGDGVVFDAGHPEHPEEGGRVYEVLPESGTSNGPGAVVLRFGPGDVDSGRVQEGDRLWKTSDPSLDRQLRQSFAGDQLRYRRPVDLEVSGRAGEPLRLVMRDELGHVVQVESAMLLASAQRQPLTEQRLYDQLSRLGGTPCRLANLRCSLVGAVMLPLSELNRLRREAVDQLGKLRARPPRWTLTPGDAGCSGTSPPDRILRDAAADGSGYAEAGAALTARVELTALVRSLPQLEAALACKVRLLYCDFDNPKLYREAVQRFRAGQATEHPYPSAIFVAPPRIFKAGEDWILRQVQASEPDGYLVRNYDHLAYFRGARMVGDNSLNVANARSARYFLERYHLERVTASYDLNHVELGALLQSAVPDWFEITLHQHMPMFHMEHCIFCAFLSSGTDYTNCGRPCDRRIVQLRDRVGAQHPVRADAGCRNTVFNALAQTGAEHAANLIALGARWFRIEFLNETPDQVGETIGHYDRLLRGEIAGGELWRKLRLSNQLGVTRGPLGRSPG